METKNKIKNFTDLIAWQKAHELALATYRITAQFPKEERYSLTDQMRRASVSITSNIAEGFSRSSYKEKAYFYSLAQGSTTELQNQFILSKDLGYLTQIDFGGLVALCITTHKVLSGLIKGAREIGGQAKI